MARKLAGAVSAPDPAVAPAALSLDEFAGNRRPSPGMCDRWFSAHPDVMAQTIAGLAKYPVGTIHRWLKDVHNFPLSVHALHAFNDRHKSRPVR